VGRLEKNLQRSATGGAEIMKKDNLKMNSWGGKNRTTWRLIRKHGTAPGAKEFAYS
jgi:hypothetical protein